MEVRYPPLKRGISAILARYPMKTRQMGAIPPSAILSRKGIARYGGASRPGPLRVRFGYGSCMERFERFRFSVPTVHLGKGIFGYFGRELTEGHCSGSGFSSAVLVVLVPKFSQRGRGPQG